MPLNRFLAIRLGFLAGALMSVNAHGGDIVQPSAPMPPFFPERSAFIHPDTAKEFSWQAEWIGTAVPAKPNQWTAFSRSFELAARPRVAMAQIAADSKYWLWVNGVLVVREGGLKRGPTPTDTYYDQVDLSSMLHAGENTLAILVWHFGKEGFSHKNSGRSGLLFQLTPSDSSPLLLVSDSTWRAQIHPAFGDTGEPHPNNRLPESNIRFDASHDLTDWTGTDYLGESWPNAISFGRAPLAPWNRLVARPIPFWKETSILDYLELKNEKESELAPPLRTIVGRLPYNAQVTPYLEVEAPAGLTIAIETDNYRGGGTPNVRAEFVTRSGRQEFECFGWMNGHEVRYSLPPQVKIVRLGYRETGYETDFVGKFHCDDDFLNRLRAKAERTLYVTMRDTYMDCPDRERAQWWGDVVNELGEVFLRLRSTRRRADTQGDARVSRLAEIRRSALFARPGRKLGRGSTPANARCSGPTGFLDLWFLQW